MNDITLYFVLFTGALATVVGIVADRAQHHPKRNERRSRPA